MRLQYPSAPSAQPVPTPLSSWPTQSTYMTPPLPAVSSPANAGQPYMTQYITPSLPGFQSPYPNMLQTTFTTVGPQVDAITIPLTPLTVLGDPPPSAFGPPTPGWPADRSPWA
eukprot:EG_transcript_59954